MAAAEILIVEDEKPVVEELTALLEKAGYLVGAAYHGCEALERIDARQPDLVILDINLDAPDWKGESIDGIEVLRRMRKTCDAAVLMLTTTSISYVKVSALTMGADDYLTKPFDPKELLARVQAILRRTKGKAGAGESLDFPGLRIEPGARRVWKGGSEVSLTPIEFELLLTMARRPGQAFTRAQLLHRAWEHKYAGDDRLVDVHVGRLRKKIENDPSEPEYIHTVWGRGYRFEGGEAGGDSG